MRVLASYMQLLVEPTLSVRRWHIACMRDRGLFRRQIPRFEQEPRPAFLPQPPTCGSGVEPLPIQLASRRRPGSTHPQAHVAPAVELFQPERGQNSDCLSRCPSPSTVSRRCRMALPPSQIGRTMQQPNGCSDNNPFLVLPTPLQGLV